MPTFISCDWGTSTFRLRLVELEGSGPRLAASPPVPTAAPRSPGANIIASLSTNAGIAATYAEWQANGPPPTERIAFYREVLEKAITGLAIQASAGNTSIPPSATTALTLDLRGIPVVISGMASSSIGMVEVAYRDLPLAIDGSDLQPMVLAPTAESPRTIYLVPGVRTTGDVMRGEETQLIGCDVREPGERMFLFPGTHSKHVFVRNGEAVDFRTYMTGEVFGLLAKQSILAGSVAVPGQGEKLPEAFFEGLNMARDYGLLHSAFITRTNELFGRRSKEDNYQFLSGVVIGAELQELMGSIYPVTLVSAGPLRELYSAAINFMLYEEVPVIDADAALIAGHCVLFARFGATIAP